MAKLHRIDTRLKIERAIEDKEVKQKHRPRLGGSQIGKPCPRAIWYGFRWATPRTITPRQERLFSRGWREEPIILADLEKAGVEIITTQESKLFCDGHAGGSSDGRIKNLPDAPKTEHLLELKTANKRNFEKLISGKSIKKWKIEYYDQAQTYMTIFGLKRCLFIVVCKDDDRRYYERLKHDPARAELLINKFWSIIYSELPPPKITNNPTEWPCIFCEHIMVCQHGKSAEKNCRTCIHAKPIKKGEWLCQKRRKKVSVKKQRKGCKKYSSAL